MCKIIYLITVLLIFKIARAIEFSSDLVKCKYNDTECMKKSLDKILENPSNNFISLDPMPIKKMKIETEPSSSINVNFVVLNGHMAGLSNFTVIKIKGFRKNMEGINEIRVKGDTLVVYGPYSVSGNVLVLPIQGQGMGNITLSKLSDIVVRFTGKPVNKNGKIYLQTNDFKATYNMERVYFHFTNLFHGDKALGDVTNQFLNNNWEEIYKEMRLSIGKSISLVMQDITNAAFAKYPYDEFFEH